jgi:hypothetical protein
MPSAGLFFDKLSVGLFLDKLHEKLLDNEIWDMVYIFPVKEDAYMVTDGDAQAALLARVERLESDLKDLKFVTLSKMVDGWFGGMDKLLDEFRQAADGLKAVVASVPDGSAWVADLNGLLADFRSELDGIKASSVAAAEAAVAYPPDDLDNGKKLRKKKRYKSYKVYTQIKDMQAEGVPLMRIAEVMRIPYSTVHSYIRLTDEALEKLRRREEVESKYESPPAGTVILRHRGDHAPARAGQGADGSPENQTPVVPGLQDVQDSDGDDVSAGEGTARDGGGMSED